jgi:hypothetical protein
MLCYKAIGSVKKKEVTMSGWKEMACRLPVWVDNCKKAFSAGGSEWDGYIKTGFSYFL